MKKIILLGCLVAFTFNAVGQTATLLYVYSGWMILSLGGTSASLASGSGPITA